MAATVEAISGPDMHAQFDHAFSDRLAVAKVARLHLAQANADARLSQLVAHGIEPFCERLAAVVALVAEKFDHEYHCSLKATMHAERGNRKTLAHALDLKERLHRRRPLGHGLKAVCPMRL